ncbi:cilia- and flagella-associated protein 299 [Colossoma macropomum]|uniref:cilia- and flagella-associated protein 299 n=1 Tax=Colossoma macropomum TaxID=42526 RepID=UPI0018648305|nr:cilia- and flagella-associated protein 299 [Colossoma macropomum]
MINTNCSAAACGNTMEEHSAAAGSENIVTQFNTYEDYLDSRIRPLDLYYLKDKKMARQLVELGCWGSGEVLKREEFETRKAAAEASSLSNRTQQKTLASAGKELKDNFLRALAEREEANRSGKMNSIIFVRDRNSRGQEISGYIDYSHRLQFEDFEPYFSGKKRFLPRQTDLSFYNWKTQASTMNDTENYQVIAEHSSSLLFKNKKDRKILNVDPEASSPGANSSRTSIQSDLYHHVVIYDHITRKNWV